MRIDLRMRRGLTLAEVLVILFLLGLLLMILLPSLSKSRDASHVSQCAANLKGMGATFSIYAAQYVGSLPLGGDIGKEAVWLTDEGLGFRALMLGRMPTEREIKTPAMRAFYCPKNVPTDMEERWQHGEVSAWGYAVMNDRGEKAVGMPVLPERKGVPLRYYAKMDLRADEELAMDVIVSDKAGGAGAHFTQMKGGALPEMAYSTNHSDKDKALGANVLCGDGHVSWRKFNEKEAVAVRQGGGREAYMWVPNP